ncbi:MBL fold metallo-hydrolase [Alicyclobacillus sp. ALC3]|uniref:MBL fold metallo-hydrolase n=1 Tax=Alicyclobacillus sp. ALC3 TaxID=2796143 RepID=UPI002379CF6C|nr:MBL fold metallo-hydrolase [Alicyclobacillus sp. ALC3]WDL95824.1 MBL fold metallo-hydrolase [Alicyclobacillus sp. ALC3]
MKINDKVHLLESTKGSYAYLVLGEEPVLIDTGNPNHDKQIVAELAQLGLKPSNIAHILLTHSDVDHIGNAKALQAASGATLWAPQEDVPYIHGEKKLPGFRRIIGATMKVDRPNVSHTYAAGQKIGDLEVIPTPGHTPGHISIRYNDILFTGDLIMTRAGRIKPAPGFLTWDKAALQKSLREVGHLTFDYVCPAHGRPVERGNLWDAFL